MDSETSPSSSEADNRSIPTYRVYFTCDAAQAQREQLIHAIQVGGADTGIDGLEQLHTFELQPGTFADIPEIINIHQERHGAHVLWSRTTDKNDIEPEETWVFFVCTMLAPSYPGSKWNWATSRMYAIDLDSWQWETESDAYGNDFAGAKLCCPRDLSLLICNITVTNIFFYEWSSLHHRKAEENGCGFCWDRKLRIKTEDGTICESDEEETSDVDEENSDVETS